MDFYNILSNLNEYKKIEKNINENNLPVYVSGLNQIHKAHFVSSLQNENGRKILFLVEDDQKAMQLKDDINFFLKKDAAMVFASRDYNFRKVKTASKEYEFARLNTLAALVNNNVKIVVASCEGASQYTIKKEKLLNLSLILKENEEIKLEEFQNLLVSSGYEFTHQVSKMGEFSVRGGIIDVFSPSEETPVRIELWGDEIDSIYSFDLVNQRRLDKLKKTTLSPTTEVVCEDKIKLSKKIENLISKTKGDLKENLLENFSIDIERLKNNENLNNIDKYLPLIDESPSTIFDYFDKDALVIVSELSNIKENIRAQQFIHKEDLTILLEENLLLNEMDSYYADFPVFEEVLNNSNTIFMDTFARSIGFFKLKELININTYTLSPWNGDIKILVEDIKNLIENNYKIVLLVGTEKNVDNVASELVLNGFNAIKDGAIKELKPKQILVKAGGVSSGFDYPDIKTAVITYPSSLHVKKTRRKKRRGEIKSLDNLIIGDYIVHNAHGIGIFQGIHKIETQGIIKDYIKIKYAGEDTLYVPVTQLDLVSKYLGSRGEGGKLRLNRLNSSQWEKTKSKVRESAKGMAKELLALYAKREKTKGFSFSKDTTWQQEFEARFTYEETEDQLISVSEIKADMEKETPMDRLLCGDVGFGKTEVALRAAFKALMDNKQVAILVPTTILAWQHYNTIIKRFGSFPVNVGLLSRFRTPAQQRETVKKLKTGEVDIVVGTHRIVQKDIKFKNLGLAIVDEEQRFGVKHKEELKKNNENVDVLTLSATPIPRTLNMAMTGIRDISLIEDPPQNRQPVQTYVLEHDEGVIKEAIKREIRRNGQVYYVHNRVSSIQRVAAKLRKDIPEARVGYAHGRMPEEELSEVWRQLLEHEIDVLVSTTIIETGVDVPNCNTLIIDNADRMGLSQLYQIRGRVGRSSRRAFAYFTFPENKVLTEISTKRLTAIKEFTDFGSGFQIAMKDLEIRGAGNLLGENQHGHMEAVGYDMYIKLLSEAVAKEKGEDVDFSLEEAVIDINIEAHIPEKYIYDLAQRLDIYKRIASVKNKEDSLDVIDELIDRFGDPPSSVLGLINVALLRNMATSLKMDEIVQKDNVILFYQQPLNMEAAINLAVELSGRVTINGSGRPYVSVRIPNKTKPLDTMEDVLTILTEVSEEK